MSIDIEKHRPLARLLLRLMGIFFAVNGITGVVSSGLDAYWNWRAHQRADAEYFPNQPLAWTLGSAVMLFIGLYLIFRGRMAMDALFHEKLEAPKVPCPRCGYDLRASAGDKCPECGESLHRTDSSA